jgi:hypothetical protein
MNKKKGFALICFYEASEGGHGSAEVTNSLYECLPIENRKLFEIKKKKIFKFLEYCNFNYLENIYKFFYIILLFNKLKKFLYRYDKKIIIIEGASWIGYSYFFIKLVNLFYSKVTLIYHAHNVEYELRKKKNGFLVSFLSKKLEKNVYKLANFATVVSDTDQKKIKKLYNIKSYIFPNGINKKRLLTKKFKFKIPEKFIIFSGSYSYFYNKLAIDKIIYDIMPKILKKHKEIKLIITGKDFPKDQFKDYSFVNNFLNLDKRELNYLIKKSEFMLTPMVKSPGTKLKIIETLLLGANLITSREGIRGIKIIKSNNLIIYSNPKELFNRVNYLLQNKKKITNNKQYYKYYLMENIVRSFFKKINL